MRLDPKRQEHYDIMSAIRGPDGYTEKFAMYCKSIFTARIRYWVGCNSGILRDMQVSEEAISDLLYFADKLEVLPEWYHHYIHHIHVALEALKKVSPKSLRGFSRKEADELIELVRTLDRKMKTKALR